jgi:CheY-like chemotaxis protein/HPt (histidine-containing phosphotransfer) domain-containing protein
LDRLSELENVRVLAVDDNETNRIILRELFTSWHMDTIVVESASAALTELRAAQREGRPVALVVTDLMMPEIDGFGLVARMKDDPALRDTHIIVLTSSGRIEDAQRCRALGVNAHLSKPFKHSILLDTILETLGSRPRKAPVATPRIPRQRPLRILIVDDNAVNQRLMVVNLESWGHGVTVANDGVEALDAISSAPFDLILMDSQMPRMGGFQATAALRRREQETGGHIPVICMTADVMKGLREQCLAAGMDGYIPKPIRREELVAAMAEAVPDLLLGDVASPEEPTFASLSEGCDGEPFDADALLAGAGNDPGLALEMVKLCCEVDAPRLCGELAAAVESGDLSAIEQAAHALKGLAGEFDAKASYAAARKLEHSAHEQRRDAIAGQAADLKREFQRLITALEHFAAFSPDAIRRT